MAKSSVARSEWTTMVNLWVMGRFSLTSYVQFSTEAEATNCIQQLNAMNVREKIIEAQKFVPKAKRAKPKQCNLYIKNFPDSWEEPRCEAYIKSVG